MLYCLIEIGGVLTLGLVAAVAEEFLEEILEEIATTAISKPGEGKRLEPPPARKCHRRRSQLKA